MASQHPLIPAERIERAILLVRGHKVMLDSDLAALYGVEVRHLVQAVKRNIERFPNDFAYQLTRKEFAVLKSQIVMSNDVVALKCQIGITKPAGESRGGRRTPPWAFTEQGVAMLSSVLRSERAVHANIEIMRAFVRLRQILLSHVDLARRLDELEQKYDKQFAVVFHAIRKLMAPPDPDRPEIGYHTLVAKP